MARRTDAIALVGLVFRARLVVLGLVEPLLQHGQNALERTIHRAPRQHEIVLEAVHEAVAELRRQLLVGRFERDLVLLGDLLQERVVVHDRVVARAPPRMNALAERQRLVRHDQVFVEVVELAEAAARRARAERRVEGERTRLELVEGKPAVRAGVKLGEGEGNGRMVE